MKTRTLLFFAAASLMLAACGGAPQRKADEAAAQTDMHTAENALDYLGTYEGSLPAADCPGIRTTLTLEEGGTYDLHRKYVDREAEFDERGSYTVEGNLLTLTRPDNDGRTYYKVEENRLRMLDAEKNPVTGVLAERYILQKTTENR